ncbi:hypothetical protein Rhe02_66200 [Rhizocola hellebori]|uniref:Secreted protein n=1 Tax=Rhizocola hellebori TaxID=1392758 RepID=A0A8J3QCV2_9ACTN|nr:hypothetical protein [Rhizocola hellebori]GIH08553.1 hypothetical protein Rhe02_66200 [Rhizocola hellebori]
MTPTGIALILFGLAVVILAGLAGYIYFRRQNLRQRFGPEYDRTVAEQDSTLAAERELLDRQRRHAQLDLKELPDDARQWYTEQWQQLQARFVESPEESIGAADELVTRLIADRGYPIKDYDEQVTLLSVEHARTIGDYREAHDIAQRHTDGAADTEELRQAIVHYRALVADLLGQNPVPHQAEPTNRSRRGA